MKIIDIVALNTSFAIIPVVVYDKLALNHDGCLIEEQESGSLVLLKQQ